MAADRRITFHRSSPPYEPGDTAGFPPLHARRLVDRGVAAYAGHEERPDFATMDRAALVRYAIEELGFEGEPPPEVTDDELRAAITRQDADGLDGSPAELAEPGAPAQAGTAGGPASPAASAPVQ